MIEISPVPLELLKAELEGLICKALPLAGNEINSGDHEACHRLKKRAEQIIVFK